MDRPVRLAVVGAGNRGRFTYGRWCLHRPDLARVVAVADRDPARCGAIGDEHGLPAERRHDDWRSLLTDLDDVDAVVIATLDDQHVAPAVALLDAGIDILLEKPIAPDRYGIDAVRTAAHRSDATVTVSHVLRYTPMFGTLKRLLDEGVIGRLVGIDHAEHIGLRLFAHAYVRGNWRREDLASPMILSKSCHDLDLLRWWADAPWTTVTSSGELTYFRSDEAPDGAPERCLDGCPVEDTCPFHAGRIYIDNNPQDGYPASVITNDLSLDGRLAVLRDGPYGRCVFRSDNDVADHQTALFDFANGVRATLTVTAFAARGARLTRFFGTRGELWGDPHEGTITIRRYQPAPTVSRPSGALGGPVLVNDDQPVTSYAHTEVVEARPPEGAFAGHGGGDDGLMQAFAAHLRGRFAGRAPTSALTSLEASLQSHEMAFAAEHSRHEGRLVHATEWADRSSVS